MALSGISLVDCEEIRLSMFPLAYSRPVGDMRCGILTLAEKWAKRMNLPVGFETADYLSEVFPDVLHDDDTLHINSNILPDNDIVIALNRLKRGESLCVGELAFAWRGDKTETKIQYDGEVRMLRNIWDVFVKNGEEIVADLKVTGGDTTSGLSPDITLIGPRESLYLDPTAVLCGCIINVKEGPVYIGPGVRVCEGAILRGPVAVCNNATVTMGARIYDATTIGPVCKVGGEVANTVFHSYTNKAHDGYLGNAVIGQWCNIGAGTNASNLKNDYTEIKLWSYAKERFLKTGLQFCGLIMGDHSKAGVNTMFNTATVVGAGCNIHGPGFPRNVIKSFSDGGAAGFSTVPLPVFFRTAQRVMARRNKEMSTQETALWTHLYDTL